MGTCPAHGGHASQLPLTWSAPRPCSRRLRAMRCACSLVLSRLMLKAMRNFRAPVAVAPQLGMKELGPKSGAHSACLSCGDTQHGAVSRMEGMPCCVGGKEEGTHPCRDPPDPPLGGGNTAPSQAGPRTPRLGWPAGSGGWPSALPHHRGTLQGEPGSSAPGGRDPEPHSQRRTSRAPGTDLPRLPSSGSTLSLCLVGWVWAVTAGHSGQVRLPPLPTQGQGRAGPSSAAPPHTDAPKKPSPRPLESGAAMGACTGRTLPFFLTCISIVQ